MKKIELKKKVKINQEIVEELNIDSSKVRFAIHRFKTKQPDLFYSTCGEFLIQTNGHRQKRFCSSRCRDRYWNEKKKI